MHFYMFRQLATIHCLITAKFLPRLRTFLTIPGLRTEVLNHNVNQHIWHPRLGQLTGGRLTEVTHDEWAELRGEFFRAKQLGWEGECHIQPPWGRGRRAASVADAVAVRVAV